MIGPSQVLNIPSIIWIQITGYILLSVGLVFIQLHSFSEIVKAVHLSTGINLDEPVLSDYAYTFHTSFYLLGSFIGPLLSSSAEYFPLFTDIMSLTSLVFAMLYLLLSVLYFSDNQGFGVNSSYYCTLSQSQDV